MFSLPSDRSSTARWAPRAALLLAALAASIVLIANSVDAYQGFGATTRGGEDYPDVHVTNLDDAGPGSLREALSAGHRRVVFDVAGEIVLASHLHVMGPFVTIDGFTAPDPGITLRNGGLYLHGTEDAHDVIVRGIRIRNSSVTGSPDGIQIAFGAHNIVIDHVSVHNAGDENIAITEGVHDITVSWSILSAPAGERKNMLIKYNPARVTLHHNLFVGANQRSPQVRIDDVNGQATDTTVDMRNNVIAEWRDGNGTKIWTGVRGNVVDNFYVSRCSTPAVQGRALVVLGARAYVAGNVSADALPTDINAVGNEPAAFPAAPVDTTDAVTAAEDVLSGAGALPRDTLDDQYVAMVTSPSCIADLVVAALSAPATAAPGSTINVSNTIRNNETYAGPFTVAFYLSKDKILGGDDVFMGQRELPFLRSGTTDSALTPVTISSAMTAGNYFLFARADPADTAIESREDNNTRSVPIEIKSSVDLVLSTLSVTSSGGGTLSVNDTVTNRGTTATPASIVRFYLSKRKSFDASDKVLGERVIPTLSPGQSSPALTTLQVPAGTAAGSYHLIARADPDNALAESSEANNGKSSAFTIP
jgi:hypothetical protein